MSSRTLQLWECVVDEVCHSLVYASTADLTDPRRPNEYCAIKMRSFPEAIRYKLEPGLVFYWRIGEDTLPHGQVVKFSDFSLELNMALQMAWFIGPKDDKKHVGVDQAWKGRLFATELAALRCLVGTPELRDGDYEVYDKVLED